MFKKVTFLLTLLVFCFVSSSAFAEPAKYLFQNATSIGHSVSKSTGTGLEAKDTTVVCSYTESGGTVTALVIDILGTIGNFDGSEYDAFATKTFSAGELSNNRATFHLIDLFATGFKANLTTLTKTGTALSTCKIARYRPGFM